MKGIWQALKRWGAFSHQGSVACNEEVIAKTLGRRTFVATWRNITKVEAWQCDLITYCEVFVMFTAEDGSGLTIGELDKGFSQVRSMMERKFPSIDSRWYEMVDMARPENSYRIIYEKPEEKGDAIYF